MTVFFVVAAEEPFLGFVVGSCELEVSLLELGKEFFDCEFDFVSGVLGDFVFHLDSIAGVVC